MFSKKATKIDKIFPVDLTGKILSIFVAFSENVNFKGPGFHGEIRLDYFGNIYTSKRHFL